MIGEKALRLCMRKFLAVFTIVFFFASGPVFSQKPAADTGSDLVGIWQLRSQHADTPLYNHWRFFKDGKFRFEEGGSHHLNSLVGMAGSYYIENGVLFIKILVVEQLTNYRIVQPGPTAQYGHFYIEGGKIKTIIQKDSKYQDHTLLLEDKDAVEIDEMPYYRLSDNPSAY